MNTAKLLNPKLKKDLEVELQEARSKQRVVERVMNKIREQQDKFLFREIREHGMVSLAI